MTHIKLENVSKLFDVDKQKQKTALALLNEGIDSAQVRERVGVSVGLYDVNIEIDKGQLHCIMGLSGSGKSTLIRHINRLIDPTQGKVWVNCVNPQKYNGAEFLNADTEVDIGHSNHHNKNHHNKSHSNKDDNQGYDKQRHDVKQGDSSLLNSSLLNTLSLNDKQLQTYRQENVSMVFQHFGLLPHMTVIQNVGYGLRVQNMAKAKRDDIARHWLNEVGLVGVDNSYPDELSGGMQQRVGLARALAVDTPIILMDEAFSALDPLIRGQLQDQLLALQDKLNKTIVFITHDIDEAIKLGTHISILNAGRLIQTGTPQQLQNNPQDKYVEQFMSARGE